MPIEGTTRRSLIAEISVTTAIVLVVCHVLYRLRFVPLIDEYLSVFVAIILLYVPILVLWRRGRPVDFLDRSFRSFARSCGAFIVTSLIVFPLFFGAAHLWQVWVIGLHGFKLVPLPLWDRVIVFQLIVIALPEEFYFRGYMQSAMNQFFPARWRILGVKLGWAWILTALVFAVAHTLITFRWWHFAIFFPALIFGYLRERAGSITAPILFHAASNILMNWFQRCYF